MSKKKRSKRKNQQKAAAWQANPRATTPRSAPAGNASAPKITSVSREVIAQAQVDFSKEYRYVLTDLRNMGILAAAMFGLVGVLALILR